MTYDFDPRLRLLIITPDDITDEEVLARTQAAFDGGARAVQLRRKAAGGLELFKLAERLRALTDRYGAWLVINGRADIAKAVSADAVHAGAAELPLSVLRQLVDSGTTIGYSAHTGDTRAACESADYVTFSPIFASPNKGEPAGTGALAEFCRLAGRPVIALGGITAINARDVVEAGAQGIAVIREVFSAASPERATRGLMAVLEVKHGAKS